MDNGYIKITEHRNNLGMIETLDYEWVGGPIAVMSMTDLVHMRGMIRQDGKVLSVGPYKARRIGTHGYQDRWVRMDYPFWWILVFLHNLSFPLQLIYSRVIITLAVWNLADFREGSYPSYKDIHIIKRIMSWTKRQ